MSEQFHVKQPTRKGEQVAAGEALTRPESGRMMRWTLDKPIATLDRCMEHREASLLSMVCSNGLHNSHYANCVFFLPSLLFENSGTTGDPTPPREKFSHPPAEL